MKIKIIILTILISFGIVIIPSSITLISEHNERLMEASEKKIIESAIKCKKEEKCMNENIFLKDLYELKYLENEFNPVTKEIYSEESYVILKDEKTDFIIVK